MGPHSQERRRRDVWAIALVGFAALVGQPAPGFATLGANSGGNTETPPNVIMLMTDDQTVESMRVMPKTNSLLVDRGVEFTNSFASNPVCCPSRATFLTGQYSHNNGVYRNTGSNGGYAALDGSRTLPVWLQRAGYFTAHVGKYLNGYGSLVPTEIPPGWSEWYGSVDPSTYSMHGYTLNQNGTLVTYGEREVEDPDTYQTDVYADKAAELIARRAPRRKPFFLSVAPLAPHSEVHPSGTGVEEFPNPRPAPRHTGAFDSEPLPVTPSSNEADVSDKPAAIRALEPMSPAQVALATTRYRSRLASLLAVDDLVRTVVDAVRATGEVDRTLIVFTSDNGFPSGRAPGPRWQAVPLRGIGTGSARDPRARHPGGRTSTPARRQCRPRPDDPPLCRREAEGEPVARWAVAEGPRRRAPAGARAGHRARELVRGDRALLRGDHAPLPRRSHAALSLRRVPQRRAWSSTTSTATRSS